MAGEVSELGATALSAGLGFLGNLGGSIGSGLFGANQARKNRAFQERMYNKQVEDNINFWKMQNEYNLPSAQLQRLKDAGLNPLLMYGEGGISGNIASQAPQAAQAPHGAQGSASIHTPIDFANLALVKAQTRLAESQAYKNEADAELTSSQTSGQNFLNWLNDNTKNIQVALKYRDYDYVNSLIDTNRNEVFQSSFKNAAEVGSLSLMNSLAIRRQNLSEYEVGQNILMGWRKVIQGDIQASAMIKQAFAVMMDATTRAKLAPAQIGLMRAQAANYNEQTRFLKGSYDFRINQEFQRAAFMKKEVTWYDLLKSSGVKEQESRIFLNTMNAQYTNTLNEYKPIDEMMTPFNMLTGFGAGLYMNGNMGRTVVKGFGR